jgi:hypothetical protein
MASGSEGSSLFSCEDRLGGFVGTKEDEAADGDPHDAGLQDATVAIEEEAGHHI